MVKYTVAILLTACLGLSSIAQAQTHTKMAVVVINFDGNPTTANYSSDFFARAHGEYALDQRFWSESSYGQRIVDWNGQILGPFSLPRPSADVSGTPIPSTYCLDGTYRASTPGLWPRSYAYAVGSAEFTAWLATVAPPTQYDLVHISTPYCSVNPDWPVLHQRSATGQDWWIHRTAKFVYTLYTWGIAWGLPVTYVLHCTQGGMPVPLSSTCTTRAGLGNLGDDPFQIGAGLTTPAFARQQRGWLPAGNVIVTQASGTWTLKPLEQSSPSGTILLTVQIPSSVQMGGFSWPTITSYYVEYRVPVGIDRNVKAGVYVRQGPNLIDMTPLTTKGFDQALLVGQTLDLVPKGAITVQAEDAASATIQVVIPN